MVEHVLSVQSILDHTDRPVDAWMSGLELGEMGEISNLTGSVSYLPEEGELNGCVGIGCVGTVPSCVISTVAVSDATEIGVYWKIVIGGRHKSCRFMQTSNDFAHLG